MSKQVTLSTVIDEQVKKAASALCKKKGYKLQYFVEKALIDQLEDEIDIEAYYARKNEETIPLEEILKSRKKVARAWNTQ